MNIHIRSFGQGIPLVFFHGWGFDSHIWEPLIPLLENYYQLFFVDLPGFGLTKDLGWSEFKKELVLRLPERFALVGWSLGGLYATRLAVEEPLRVRQVLNVTTSPYFLADSSWPGLRNEIFQKFYNNLQSDFKRVLREFISLQVNKGRVEIADGITPSREALQAGLNVLAHWDLRKSLQRCDLPIYYMFGRLDPIVPVKTMEHMTLNYPQFQYVLFDKAAHMPFLSHSQLFVEELKGFIK